MYKALLYNLKDHYSIHEILESKTFEPEFAEYSDNELDSLTDYRLIVLYLPNIDVKIIRKIRENLFFHCVTLLVLSDVIDVATNKQALKNGADFVELKPDTSEELTPILKKIHDLHEESSYFPKNVLEPFRLSTCEIFQMMAMMNAELVQEYKITTHFHFGEVSAVMALAGKKKGGIILSLNEKMARLAISNISAIPADDLEEDDVHDGVGELINMIAGGAKARLTDEDEHFLLSAPTVITGRKHRVIQQKDMPCAVMVYRVDDEYFAIQICLMALTSSAK
jgi:chemotaxis protein CheX